MTSLRDQLPFWWLYQGTYRHALLIEVHSQTQSSIRNQLIIYYLIGGRWGAFNSIHHMYLFLVFIYIFVAVLIIILIGLSIFFLALLSCAEGLTWDCIPMDNECAYNLILWGWWWWYWLGRLMNGPLMNSMCGILYMYIRCIHAIWYEIHGVMDGFDIWIISSRAVLYEYVGEWCCWTTAVDSWENQ